jgi:hypothetical protein
VDETEDHFNIADSEPDIHEETQIKEREMQEIAALIAKATNNANNAANIFESQRTNDNQSAERR